MTRNAVRLSPPLRRWTYVILGLLYLTGCAWQGVQWLPNANAGPGSSPASAGPWLMRLHGAAAMAALLVLGVLFPLHLRRGWLAHRNRASGMVVTGSCAVLIATGYALYYVGGETSRQLAAYLHLGLGIVAPIALLGHSWLGRKSRASLP